MKKIQILLLFIFTLNISFSFPNFIKPKPEEIFYKVDKNKDNLIDKTEFLEFKKMASRMSGNKKIETVNLEKFDLDKDEKLNLEEFKHFFEVLEKNK